MPEPARRNPDWEREEVILACDLVAQDGWRQLEDSDPRVVQLSTLLQGLPLHPLSARRPDFRNPNGVGRKTADIATAHPDYRGVRTHGGRTDRDVIAEFLADPVGMHELAQTLRDDAVRGDFRDLTNPVDDEDFDAPEGRLLIRRHVTRERSRTCASGKYRTSAAAANSLPARHAASTSSKRTATAAVATSSATIGPPFIH